MAPALVRADIDNGGDKADAGSKKNRIVQLSDIISDKTQRLDAYFTRQGIKTPSFNIDAPVDIDLPSEIALLREQLLDANTELNELILGPRGVVVDFQYNYFVSIHSILNYDIVHAFPVGGQATYAEISRYCGLDEDVVRRLLRHAVSNRCFREVRPGVIEHTALSRLFAEDPYLADYTLVGCEEMTRTTTYVVPAMRAHPNSQEPGHSAFSLANGTERSCYEIVGSDPVRARRFMNCMSMNLMGPGFGLDHIAGDATWASLPADATVVDVGGSHGDVAVNLAHRYQGFNLVVQDLSSTIENAEKAPLPSEVKDRIKFMAHDFFTPQPVKGADVYFFRWIFHNWSEKYCLSIVENLVPALKSGAKVVVNEWCLPEPSTVPNRIDRRMRGMDVGMLMLFNSQERDPKEWTDLFARASPRFVFEGITKTEGANLSMLTFTYV